MCKQITYLKKENNTAFYDGLKEYRATQESSDTKNSGQMRLFTGINPIDVRPFNVITATVQTDGNKMSFSKLKQLPLQ